MGADGSKNTLLLFVVKLNLKFLHASMKTLTNSVLINHFKNPIQRTFCGIQKAAHDSKKRFRKPLVPKDIAMTHTLLENFNQ
jgi:hypothetical protein